MSCLVYRDSCCVLCRVSCRVQCVINSKRNILVFSPFRGHRLLASLADRLAHHPASSAPIRPATGKHAFIQFAPSRLATITSISHGSLPFYPFITVGHLHPFQHGWPFPPSFQHGWPRPAIHITVGDLICFQHDVSPPYLNHFSGGRSTML